MTDLRRAQDIANAEWERAAHKARTADIAKRIDDLLAELNEEAA